MGSRKSICMYICDVVRPRQVDHMVEWKKKRGKSI